MLCVLFQGEEITCKCSKVFNINVILKHLNHPKVQCAKFFTPHEMEMLEEEAKKRTDKEKKRRWRNSEKFKIKEMIDTINQNLDKNVRQMLPYPEVSTLEYCRNSMINLVRNHEKQRILELNTWFDELWETRINFDNVDDVTVDIWNWKNDVKFEIVDTCKYLFDEIFHEIRPYIVSRTNSSLLGTDIAYFKHIIAERPNISKDYIGPRGCGQGRSGGIRFVTQTMYADRSGRTLHYEIKSLLTYVDWRLQNLYNCIIQKTVIFVKHLENQRKKHGLIPLFKDIEKLLSPPKNKSSNDKHAPEKSNPFPQLDRPRVKFIDDINCIQEHYQTYEKIDKVKEHEKQEIVGYNCQVTRCQYNLASRIHQPDRDNSDGRGFFSPMYYCVNGYWSEDAKNHTYLAEDQYFINE